MAASSLDSLRDMLRVVLDREDKYLKNHKYMHERIHRIDRSLASPDTQSLPRMTMRHVRVKAVRRIERAWKTVKTQQEKRRELLARTSALASIRVSATNCFLIIEMEIEIKTAGEDTKPEDADEDMKSQGARRRHEDHAGRQKHKDQAGK